MKGDRFMEKRFTVPASAGSPDYCMEHGHTMPDAKGRCLRCGSRTTTEAYRARLNDDRPTTTEAAMRGH